MLKLVEEQSDGVFLTSYGRLKESFEFYNQANKEA